MHVFSFQMQQKSVDSYQPTGRHIPSCRLQLEWTGKELTPPPLSHSLKVTGVSIAHISIDIPLQTGNHS